MSHKEQRLKWVYLVNLVFYLVPVWFRPYSLAEIGWQLLALLAFLACYFYAYSADWRRTMQGALGIVLVASLITPVTFGSISLFAFAAFFFGFVLSLRRFLLSTLLLGSWIALLGWWLFPQVWEFSLYGNLLVLGIGTMGQVEQWRQKVQRQQQQSSAEISQLATQLERERIARDLHDVLGHSLSSVILKADLAVQLLKHQQLQQALDELEQLRLIARESLSQVRHTVAGYRHKGWDSTVQPLLELLRQAGFAVELDGHWHGLTEQEEQSLVPVLTELVTNVIRHSQGRQVWLRLQQSDSQRMLQLKDDGVCSVIEAGAGLQGIAERLNLLGGQLSWQTNPTCFDLTIPRTKA